MHARLTAVAVIGFAAVTAALCAPSPAAHAAAASGNAGGGSIPRLMRVLHAPRVHAARPGTYRLRPGDYLSKVAARFCGDARDWIGIWHATRGIADPNVVPAGLDVTVACDHSGPGWYPPPAARSYRQAPQPARECDGDGDRDDAGCPGGDRAADAVSYRAADAGRSQGYASSQAGYGAAGSFEACVIARESGGNAQVMNSSGHYGLYQFSESTWEAYGGSAASFGHASPAEQRRVFLAAIARGGQSNWSPYDGCHLWRVL